ncbi:hypothetical protein GN244_ATG01732 [Phytophthora infestans]|uniref:Uncharacterized protein n=1 Tax=Phytophthora infestans TaxID=4787 RepID=A0A833TFR3_PHYIN|nr:hypothetical protein GN244_ATG01732 [Phytophthora infestans]KAF4133571.1 hypothetical protein GN958_ATG16908 [Phytophthora infestans]
MVYMYRATGKVGEYRLRRLSNDEKPPAPLGMAVPEDDVVTKSGENHAWLHRGDEGCYRGSQRWPRCKSTVISNKTNRMVHAYGLAAAPGEGAMTASPDHFFGQAAAPGEDATASPDHFFGQAAGPGEVRLINCLGLV